MLQGTQAERRPELHVDGGDVEVSEILNSPHMYPTLRHPCHTAVDMLSPGAMPSSTGCSVDCGLEAERLAVGGCGGGSVGLCRGFGVGRDLVKVLAKLEGEARGGTAAGESWPEAKGYPCG